MTDNPHDDDTRLPAIGQPADEAGSSDLPDVDPDFSNEHQETAVSDDILTGADTEREPESPRGWSGMQR